MIFHLVALDAWRARPDRDYAPESLGPDGFVHCSPDPEATLAVATAFYRETAGPLLALVIDERKLAAEVRWEGADPVPPPGVAAGTLFPHVYGAINRDAVVGLREVRRDEQGRALALVDRVPD